MPLYSRSSPISKLSNELLCMIFSATRELDERNLRTWDSNVLLSHVCQSWRHLAIQYAMLWDELIWSPANSVDLALTVLERSKSAPLRIDIDAMACLHKPPPSSDHVVSAHSVIRTALSHLSRMAVCALSWSDDYWDPDVFAPLFSPLNLPHLRELVLRYQSRAVLPPALPVVQVVCDDLLQLHLQDVVVKNWASMLGETMSIVTLTNCDIEYDDFLLFLESAPDLVELHLGWMDILKAPRDSDKVVGNAMDSLKVSHLELDTLRIIGRLLPIDKIDNVELAAHYMEEDQRPFWLDFLRIPSIAKIAKLHLYHDVQSMLSVIAPNSMRRTLTSTRSVLPLLPAALDGLDMFSTLEMVALDITQWADFMDLVAAAPAGPCMPALQEIRLAVNQSDISPSTASLRDYAGPVIAFPRLSSLDIGLLGPDPPSQALAQTKRL
ncbi:hypothetical protein EXIGLDRAFT_393411 [Exidia glandulosa HHB12029]|uniref:F-box domain-containing protein n=1 Tax=Exidia glandulosa HHB12029 TaxID=1314781 RepID=A0A165KWV8_EXIGL|nr:hypothetical protein EXIGLDRAFT_393411 [Exidia glandulosa HHB12029]